MSDQVNLLLTRDLTEFDAFEFHPCGWWVEADGTITYEQIGFDEIENWNEEHVVYSVYGHLPGKGLVNLADCFNPQTMMAVYAGLTELRKAQLASSDVQEYCTVCRGLGQVHLENCYKCKGTGREIRESEIEYAEDLDEFFIEQHVAVTQYPYEVRIYSKPGATKHYVSPINLHEALILASNALIEGDPWMIYISQKIPDGREHTVFSYVNQEVALGETDNQ